MLSLFLTPNKHSPQMLMNQCKFLLIDDDPVNNRITKLTFEKIWGENLHINVFTKAKEGLDFIVKTPPSSQKTFLFLDINMPEMSGWEFLEAFDKLHQEIKNRYTIYILSSSIDNRDKKRAESHLEVVDFLVKPLKLEKLKQIEDRFLSAS